MESFVTPTKEGGSPLFDLVTSKKIIVLLGAGGVGKTTTAITTALLGAMAGRRVALLSIDPAKRLAAALGMSLGSELRRIEGVGGVEAGEGWVDAAMLDQKAVFDRMVTRHAKDPESATKILEHPLYIAASTNLAGPLEYMALAKLQELAEDPRYDLVVLDTPPDTHALDFLARPNVLAGFMDHKVMSWLIKPFLLAGKFGLGRLLHASEKLMGGLARVTGTGALRSFAEFLVLIQEVLEGFQKSGENIATLLRSPETGFILVTVPSLAAARSACHLHQELIGLGYLVELVLINRCLNEDIVRDVQLLPSGHPRACLELRIQQEGAVCKTLAERVKAPAMMRVSEQIQELGSTKALMSLAYQLSKGV